MSDLGALLELIHGAHSRVCTFEAEYQDWSKPPPTLELRIARSESGESRVRWRADGPFPRTATTLRRLWLKAPQSLRVEIVQDKQLVTLGVLDGDRWWHWVRGRRKVSGDLASDESGKWTPPPPLLTPPLVNPASLLAALRFEPVGLATRAGRDVVVARALPRRLPLAKRSLSYEFEFDSAHGTVLRRSACEDGRVVSVTEATAVAYDRPVKRDLFVFRSPDGSRSTSCDRKFV